ncbi:MAG: 50S ribosomal protein L29 [Candidatus Chaera renei]|uniref:Large ribosomal subunit protein uL29 n=1 Tax=Candidatus Chaera renei TaxID=2506947 RepID=A0A4Q0AJK1_9BACT|nr:MAG: 50S ribosomal protein L29 [Candidatus Chaera renei]
MAKTTAKPAQLNPKQLAEALSQKRADLAEKKRSLKAGELVNPRSIRAVRREIARLLTALNGPAPAESPSKPLKKTRK